MTLTGKQGPSENYLGENRPWENSENGPSENGVTLRGKHGPGENGLGENRPRENSENGPSEKV